MIDIEKEQEAARLRGSLLEFTKFFYQHITGRQFIVAAPIGRESHIVTICRTLTDATRLQTIDLSYEINVPPGHGKSTLVSCWIAWCWTLWPDSQFIYTSYAQELAAKHTAFVKDIVGCRMYSYLFDVELKKDSRAKDSFETTAGGGVKAFGSAGAVTGQNAGLPGLERFSGALIIDDPIKPDDVFSDTIRESIKQNYINTLRQRNRGITVPFIFIGQRLHEDDLGGFLLSGEDTRPWNHVVLKGLDDAGNALAPHIKTREQLLILQKKSPYVYASQYQQDPLPAGGGVFKKEWFVMLDEEPEMLVTFITADTAESEKDWNDATVFSFFGLYEIETMGKKTGEMGLHWLDCVELRIEPKDLKDSFIDFYTNCVRHPKVPRLAAIEKKSTGVTLLSVLQDLRGIQIREIERTKESGSKTKRFVEMQPFIASKLISFTSNARHAEMCREHMKKITANNTHRHDDIADTLSDAIRIALIEKTMYAIDNKDEQRKQILTNLNNRFKRRLNAGANQHGRIG